SSYWCDFDPQNRLVTSSLDGYLRLYSAASYGFSLVAKSDAPGGQMPWAAVFSPAGDKIAVGFNNSTNVNVLDGQTLAFLYAPDTTGIDNGNLSNVTWSQDGNSLYAGGKYIKNGLTQILYWSQAELGNYTTWQASTSTIMDIRSLKNGGIVYGAADPTFAVLDNAGNKIFEQGTSIADYSDIQLRKAFLISHEGNTVQFAFEKRGTRPARFSLSEQHLVNNPQPDANLIAPDFKSLKISWRSTDNPTINGKVLPLEQGERSRSLAIASDKSKFLLGAEWNLYLFDNQGQRIWKVAAPEVAWGVNISGDGKKAVAAFGDGTIRWYNMEKGEELFAFFPHKDGKRWIAWTKSGYYMSSGNEADKLIGWHTNNGKDQAANFLSAGALYASHKRPDIVQKMLVTLNENEAIRQANLEKGNVVEKPVSEAITEVENRYRVKPDSSGLGKAILIAASGVQDENSLFPYTLEFTTEMYRVLHQKGFSDGDVIFMSPRLPVIHPNGYASRARQDFDLQKNPLDLQDNPKTQLQQAFTQASNDLSPDQQFIFYLHGHASADLITIAQDEKMSAQELKELLAQIPTDVEQIIILDTCHSGSFLDELAGVPNRLVITSADANSKAWSPKSNSFADNFIQKLSSGSSVGEAFELAESMITKDPDFREQRPQMDDTQDGFYDGNDGQLARRVFIGNPKEPSLPPEIIEVHPPIRLVDGQSTATLWVKTVPDLDHMKKVQAILVNESDGVTEYQGESTDFTQRELTLVPNYKLQRYQIDYDQFHTANNWTIRYTAQSMEGDWSETQEGYVVFEGVDIATQVKTHLNKTTYTEGDNMQLDVTLSGETTVDLYVGIIFPQGDYQTIASPLNFSQDNVLQSYQTGLLLSGEQTFQIINLALPAIAIGDYQACGLLTRAGSDPYNEANWLLWDCKGFHFQ
ncbi:MAG: hypothetical protein DRR19_21060, partial [Candidatus Parabeggiatoa sp. nov. 1]